MIQPNKKVQIGDCEVSGCDKTNVEVYTMHGNILMCSEHRDEEIELVKKMEETNSILINSRKIDSAVEIKPDLFNAATIPAIELYAAIQQDDSIPADKKQYRYAKESETRMLHFQKVVFEARQKLREDENKMRMWQVTTQAAAGKLSAEQRAEFRALDVTYEPDKPKTIKPTPVKSKKTFQKEEVKKFASQYGVPEAGVQMIVVSKNMSPEDAAKELARMMGKTK